MNRFIHFTQYSPAADIVVMSVCLVMNVLARYSYFSRTRSSRLFLKVVGLVFAAAVFDVSFYSIAVMPNLQFVANWMRCFFHATLLLIFVYYIAYICEVTHYEKERLFVLIANIVFAVVMLADVIVTLQGLTFVVEGGGISFIRRGIFIYGYLCYIILCVVLLIRVWNLLFHRVMLGFYGTIAVSFLVLIIQGMCNQSSYTVASLLLPAIAMMYVLHSNPYDIALGANDETAMQDYVKNCFKRKKDFIFMSLYLKEIDQEGREFPEEVQANIRQFTYRLLRNCRLFKTSKGHMILIFLKDEYPDYEEKIKSVLKESEPICDEYNYKIVIGESVDDVSESNEYLNYIRDIHKAMNENEIHRISNADFLRFKERDYIVKELSDIYYNENLNDPRVLVYCQPVLNVASGNFDSAEILMRLDLKDTGIVYPDQFIYLAEEYGYIHMLTQIILHKACEAIRQYCDQGYVIRRFSVNVSALELRDEDFCSCIIGILKSCGIPGGKIAIELTESQNEDDFNLMKQKINELKQEGIQFYLDDFGTGYSNMERIIELPFDIIKFDRSLVMACAAEDRSRKMVADLANLFAKMHFAVLYEGVEKEEDEKMCKDMYATYLQGYKYSKPVPIAQLSDYLNHSAS